VKCRKINRILMIYNAPRYPGIGLPEEEEIRETIGFIERFINEDVVSKHREME
jgi:hypothetical protein